MIFQPFFHSRQKNSLTEYSFKIKSPSILALLLGKRTVGWWGGNLYFKHDNSIFLLFCSCFLCWLFPFSSVTFRLSSRRKQLSSLLRETQKQPSWLPTRWPLQAMAWLSCASWRQLKTSRTSSHGPATSPICPLDSLCSSSCHSDPGSAAIASLVTSTYQISPFQKNLCNFLIGKSRGN